MPRVHWTLEEREHAEGKRREEKQKRELRAGLNDKIYRKINYDYIREKTGLSKTTIVKVVNNPELATVAQLRAICNVADISLVIAGE